MQDDYGRTGSEWARQAETGQDVVAWEITEKKIYDVLSFARI